MLALDTVALRVPDVSAARAFYSAVFAPDASGGEGRAELDLRGAGRLVLEEGDDGTGTGFGGFVLTYIVAQPSEVENLLRFAAQNGARALKPFTRGFFGETSGVFQAPGGAIWKVAAPTRKDTGPAATPPRPTETAALLGAASPKASRDFYVSLGMAVDRDYGNKYIDFRPAEGRGRLGLMQPKALAKDAGTRPEPAAPRAIRLVSSVPSRGDVDAVLAAAAESGGRITAAAAESGGGRYHGCFADLDGFEWQVASG